MRVLVTGATGFVGGRVAARLRRHDDEVVALVRSPSPALARIGVEQEVGDLTRADDVAGLVRGVDRIVHAAASLDDDLAAARRVNRDGTAAVVDAALAAGATPLVHVSTTSVYDRAAAGDIEITEDHDLVSSTSSFPYALTKAEAEAEVARGVAEGLSALVLRPPAVLGAGPTSTWGSRVPHRLREGTLPPRDPASTFAWVHVEDLVDAVLAGLDEPRSATVNVVGGHTTVDDYLERIARIVDAPRPDTSGVAPGWRGRLAADRLEAVLGVRARRGLDAALDEIAASWSGGHDA